MPDVKWIHLSTGTFDDEKIRLIEAMPDADTLLVIWVKLICLAGKVNADGYIFLSRDIPYSDNDLAALFNRPVNSIKLALTTFQHFKMIKLDDAGNIFLINWDKHQNVIGLDSIREQARIRQQNSRNRKSLNDDEYVSRDNNVTQRDNNVNSLISNSISNSSSKSKSRSTKNSYGEFKNVLLTDEEYQKLLTRFNEKLPGLIESLSLGIESKGYKYKSHYAAILTWARKDFAVAVRTVINEPINSDIGGVNPEKFKTQKYSHMVQS